MVAAMFLCVMVLTCVVSATGLLHANGLDGILVLLLPEPPVLVQGGCGYESSAELDVDPWSQLSQDLWEKVGD